MQTLSRFGVPSTTARTRWMFGFQRRLVFFFDHGTLCPKPGPLAQMSQTAATGVLLVFSQARTRVRVRRSSAQQRDLPTIPDRTLVVPIARQAGAQLATTIGRIIGRRRKLLLTHRPRVRRTSCCTWNVSSTPSFSARSITCANSGRISSKTESSSAKPRAWMSGPLTRVLAWK